MSTRSASWLTVAAGLFLLAGWLRPAAGASNLPERLLTLEFDAGTVSWQAAADGARLELAGARNGLGAIGTPDLPARIVQLEIPRGSTVRAVTAEVLAVEPVAASLRVVPTAPDGRVGDATAPAAVPVAGFYAGDAPFPARLARFAGRGALRGHIIATLHVQPWIYHPRSGRLELVTRLRLRLELAAAAPLALERYRIDPRIEARFEPQLARQLSGGLESAIGGGTGGGTAALVGNGPAGPGPFQPTFRPTTDGSAVEYVIVTGEALAADFQRLADWKTQKGVQAVVRTVEWIDQTYPNGVDRAERVRFFLRDAYQNWGTLWVLLGGDTDVVPYRTGYTTLLGGESIPTDYYFMCLNGNWNSDGDDIFGEGWSSPTETGDGVDLLPELYLGRAPVSTPEQAQGFVDKVLAYEQAPAAGDGYPPSALFLAERLFPSFHGAEVAEEAVAILESEAPWFKIVKLYEESASWPGSLELTHDAAVDSISNGFGIVHHVGHGFRNTMSVGEESLTNADADALTNAERQSVVFAINCSSASIDFNSIGERFVKNPHGGSISYYGTSRFAFVNASRDIQGGWYTMVFRDSVRTLGEACTLVRLPWAATSEFDNAFRWTLFALTLIGDPETSIWTIDPEPLDVAHAATHELGSGPLAVSVTAGGSPVSGATVTAWRDGEFFARAVTDGAGGAQLDIPAENAGDCSLTVQRSNTVPYQGTVTLTSASGPYAFIEALVVDDDAAGDSNGDGDGLADAGETVELGVTVRNGGGGGLSGASGVITADDPGGYLTLVADTVSYGSIAAGGASAGAGPFVVQIDPSAPEAFQPVFTLTLTASEGSWSDLFVLPVRRPYVEHRAHTVDDAAPRGNGNGLVEAGEEIWYTIDARNSGQETARQVSATLRVLRTADGQPEPLVTVNDDQMSFGDIAPGGTVTGDRFEFLLDSGLDPSTIWLEVSYTDFYGQTWGDSLDVIPPGAPDSLRAFGSTTSITLKWRAPADDDLLGYDIYRAPLETGPFVRVNAFIAAGSSLFEDPELPALSRFYYQVVARDSSYNEGPPSDVFSGTTNPPAAAGWPIETGQNVSSSLQMADIDGDWQLELFTASDFEYGWHADGNEIVDGDNDPRTSGVFALDGFDGNKGFSATTAIGDVDGDGDLETCNVGWTVKEVYLWDNLGNLLPGWPRDVLDDFNWASPVLADLDLDGDLEVVVWAAKGGRLFAWHHDGTEVADGDNNPATDGVLRRITGVSFNYSSPAVGNLDADPEPEIVFCTNLQSPPTDPQGAIYVVNASDGSDLPGWPVFTSDGTTPSQITASPALADLDGDGSSEIIVTSELSAGTLHVFRADGSNFPGWPKLVSSFSSQVRVGSPSVGDVDGDSQLDIVYPASDGRLWAWNWSGSALPGFPVTYLSGVAEATQSTAALGDLDGDGLLEIVFGDEKGHLHAFHHDATPVDGFPIQLNGEVRSTPIIWDIDNDGLVEVAVSGWDSNIYMWDLPAAWNPQQIPWPLFRHDAANTGDLGTSLLPVGVADPGAAGTVSARAWVSAPYPNPFNPRTRFAVDVPAGAGAGQQVEISIFDVQGRLVRRLLRGALEPGRHLVEWDGRAGDGSAATTGVYFYRAAIGPAAMRGKLTLVK